MDALGKTEEKRKKNGSCPEGKSPFRQAVVGIVGLAGAWELFSLTPFPSQVGVQAGPSKHTFLGFCIPEEKRKKNVGVNGSPRINRTLVT